jgi:hypothetical protein
MRDFRNARAMAQTLRAALAVKGVKITISESLELTAKALGAPDWNTLSAAIKAAETRPETPSEPIKPPIEARPAPPAPSPVAARPGSPYFSAALEATLHRAVASAAKRRHGYTTLEHLLLELIEDPDASVVMEACRVDLGVLKATLVSYIDDVLKSLIVTGDPEHVAPTAGFHRVIQRAVIHVQASGRDVVTGANALVAIFSERESHACAFLEAQKMNRFDAVNFIAHGIRKGGAAA